MRCVGALLDNAQKLHAARRRGISIVHHNEHPSDTIQYFTTPRYNRPAHLFSPFIIRRWAREWTSILTRYPTTACSPISEIDVTSVDLFLAVHFTEIRFDSAQGRRAKPSSNRSS